MAERSWREAHTTGVAAQSEDGVAPTSVPDVEFSILYVRSAAEAAKAIQGALLQLRCVSPKHREHTLCPLGKRKLLIEVLFVGHISI